MKSLKSIHDLIEIRGLVSGEAYKGKAQLIICAGTGGQASGSNDIIRVIKRQILERNIGDRVAIRLTGCLGFCEMDPFILVEPGNFIYPKLKTDHIPIIIDSVLSGVPAKELLYKEPGTSIRHDNQQDIPFFKGQSRTVLGNNQLLDPIRILDYIRVGGYNALQKVLSSPDHEWIIQEVQKSGLRGRGGAGFPTGRKWDLARKSDGGTGLKYLICNADEGDPGAYMDRSILEGNPHSIIEGMIVAGIAIGATKGIIYVRSEYPLAIKHTNIAIRQAMDMGLLGENIMGTGINFNIEIVRGAGAFVCGEETALIRSIEGRMGEPRQRPPYPIEKGLFGRPTCINNVETLANIPVIINEGGEEYAKTGIPGNTGTKIFSLVGKIRNTGLVEVPLGIPINQVVYDIGGGSITKSRIKAVQTGGPSGGCIPAEMFDIPISYDSLTKAGSIMGSGGMIVMDENTCMVDVAKYFMSFLKGESCGKCFTCRKGTQRMYEILEDISQGKGTSESLKLLEELATVVKDTTMCALGQSAANPVLSTLRYFRSEYEEHIKDKRCAAFVCEKLVGAPCQAACPVDTEPWRYVALVEKGEYEEAYKVIREANPFPSACARACDRKCEHRCNLGTTGGEAIAIRALKRFVTDRVDPSVYKPAFSKMSGNNNKKIAVVGAGPAGLTAAHYLSILGYKVTVYEAEDEPGGMLMCALPAYRLPVDVVRNEVKTLLNNNITLKCGMAIGRDISVDGLLADGFNAVFLAIGAHESWRLNLEDEDVEGIYPSIKFLKAFNMKGEELAFGHVGIVGGGNSAVDAARVALRQKKVDSVTLFYRRTRDEMPAYEEEVEAALEEGVRIETLVSPVKLHVRQEDIEAAIKEGVELETLVTPVKIYSREGRLTGIECIRNKLGDVDIKGRRKPVTVPGTEFRVPLDTLIVAIGEKPGTDLFATQDIITDSNGRLKADPETLTTNREGVFAGGDLVTGPNTVVDAISAGKKAARIIDRYIKGKDLKIPAQPKLPAVFIEPAEITDQVTESPGRAVPYVLPAEKRFKNFEEVERVFSVEQARQEAQRCLRCDLVFTRSKDDISSEDILKGAAKL